MVELDSLIRLMFLEGMFCWQTILVVNSDVKCCAAGICKFTHKMVSVSSRFLSRGGREFSKVGLLAMFAAASQIVPQAD